MVKSTKRIIHAFELKVIALIPLRKVLIDLCLLAFLVSIPFWRVGLAGVIRPLDSDFPIYPIDQLSRYSYTWFEFGATFGNDGSFTSLSQVPYYLVPAFLSYIGLPINIVNRLTLISYATLVAWSAYAMTFLLIPERKRFAPILAGLFFFYNPYLIGEINLGHWLSILSYSALPIIVAAFIKGLNEIHWKKWALILGVTSILVIPRIRFLPIVVEFLGIYLILWFSQKWSWSKMVHSLKFFITVFCAILALNLWWILPTIVNLNSVYSLLVTPPTSSFLTFSFPTTFLTNLSVFNIVGLAGYGIPLDQSYGAYFQSPLHILVELLLLLFTYCVLILRRNEVLNFFAVASILFLGSIIAITCIQPIYNLYVWLSLNCPSPLNFLLFPLGFEYRELPIALSYAFLVGAGYNEIVRKNGLDKLKRLFSRFCNSTVSIVSRGGIWSKLLAIFLVFLIIANSWPLFGGGHNDFLEPVIVPSYYDEARQFLILHEDNFKVLSVPHPYWILFVKYPWAFNGSKDITDFIQQVSPVPILSSKPGFGYSQGSELLNIIYDTLPTVSSQKLLSLLGGKYIVVRNDVIDNSFNLSSFKNQTNFILETSIGALDFYRNPYYSPTVYPSSSLYSIWGNEDSLIPLTYVPGFQWNNITFVSLNDLSQESRDLWMNFSKGLIVFNPPLEDGSIINSVNEKQIPVLYLFNWTFPRSIKIPRDGLYVLESSATANGESEISVLNLTKDEILGNPNFDFSLPSSSISIYGTSQENDSATMETSDLLSNSNIRWQSSPDLGWHALFITLNRTDWQLGRLAQENGAIIMRIKGDQSGREIRLSVMGTNESRFAWPTQTIYLNWDGWKELVLPLNQFDKIGTLDWDEPWALWIWQEVPNETTPISEIQISNITRLHGPNFSILRSNEASATTTLSETTVEIDKKSPVEYQINVSAEKPFFLILNQAYNNDWKAFIKNQALPHFRANFYANGYYVPAVGNFSIEIVYSGQQYFELGAFISVTAIVLSGIYIGNVFQYFRVIAYGFLNRVIVTVKTLLQRLFHVRKKQHP